ncbi:uncharacterized protein [Rutidosis leptorrhynchoides]|uniref:uncharacterized protein n=1 Tax=Rutidosis leptorrhynchoides TaxID=125765 RepID=UPI003A9A1508
MYSKYFWRDPWIGNDILATRFPRLFALDSAKKGSVASHLASVGWFWEWRRSIRGGAEQEQLLHLLSLLSTVSISEGEDRWWWDYSTDGLYRVSSARSIIASFDYAPFTHQTDWCNSVPIKINIFVWRLKLHRLATLRNLESKDLSFDNSCCALCDVSEESHSHLFVRCDTSYQLWCKVGSWLDISIPIWNSVDDVWIWINSFSHNRNKKLIISVIAYSTIWNIWKLRNDIIFKEHKFRKSHVFDAIVVTGFNWLYARYHKSTLNWTEWLQNPLCSL